MVHLLTDRISSCKRDDRNQIGNRVRLCHAQPRYLRKPMRINILQGNQKRMDQYQKPYGKISLPKLA